MVPHQMGDAQVIQEKGRTQKAEPFENVSF